MKYALLVGLVAVISLIVYVITSLPTIGDIVTAVGVGGIAYVLGQLNARRGYNIFSLNESEL
jgi:uncharacterized protein (DUF697 family)